MRNVRKKTDRNAGFTLIEVIISVAVLSIASVFVLQMFVTAARLNENARNIDQANSHMATLMEYFLLLDDPMALETRVVEMYEPVITMEGETKTILCYYDADWKPVGPQSSPTFQLKVVIEPNLESEGPTTPVAFGAGAEALGALRGRVYTMTLTCAEATSAREIVELATSTIQHYFQIKEDVR